MKHVHTLTRSISPSLAAIQIFLPFEMFALTIVARRLMIL